VRLPPIDSVPGRKAWAFIAIVGGCMVFTVFAAFGVWFLRSDPGFTFWLALAAHLQVFVGMGALGWTLGRRAKIVLRRDGAEVDDREGERYEPPAPPAMPATETEIV
jgi:hypothetical protein